MLRDDIERLGLHKGSFPSPNGHPWTWVFNFRDVFLDRNILTRLAYAFWERAPKESFQLGAIETAAVPLLVAIGFVAPWDINLFTVRKEPKPHGLREEIEGKITDDPILLLDDIFNSGASIEKARAALAKHGREIGGIFVVVDFKSPKGILWRAQHQDIPVNSMFSLADFNLTYGQSS